MKKIYFMRHSKSDQSTQCSDIDRPLNKRGERDAPFMAKRLKHYKVKPSLIISSPATRASDTAKIVAKTLRYPMKNIVFNKNLYCTSPAQYLEVVQGIDKKHDTIIIFGHNPSITEVCELLSNSIIGNIPTSGIFCIEFDTDDFKKITARSGKVLFFDLPKKHTR